MRLPTLEEFIANKGGFPTNSFVTEPDFEELYVRRSRRWFGNKMLEALDIARVTAWVPGKGAWTRLSERLLAQGINLYVESVMNPRFEQTLLKQGFSPSETNPASFYKRGMTITSLPHTNN